MPIPESQECSNCGHNYDTEKHETCPKCDHHEDDNNLIGEDEEN